jgi:phosphoribosyl-ATP pyrophosphohydrolase/phosphoribosyl-AMP cyclohydrolase
MISIKYDEHGLVPAIVQEEGTGVVLMLAYMNEASLGMSLETGFTHFWSRSRRTFWKKGETSGHLQEIRAIHYDCDADTLLVTVRQTGAACHTGEKSCFYRLLGPGEAAAVPFNVGEILARLEGVIEDRKANPREGSHVGALLRDGGVPAAAKVLEESGEAVRAFLEKDHGQVVWEAADLLFHLLVMLHAGGADLNEVTAELQRRFDNPPRKDRTAGSPGTETV